MIHPPMRRAAALAALALILCGCNDHNGDSITTTPAPPTPVDNAPFAEDPTALARNPWHMPTAGVAFLQETMGRTWSLSSQVSAGARPGGLDAGLLVSGTDDRRIQGQRTDDIVSIQIINDGLHVVSENSTAFLTDLRNYSIGAFALGKNNAILSPPYSYSGTWSTFLPASTAVGTEWSSTLIPTIVVGKAFAYSELGAVSYRPTIRSGNGALLTADDPVTTVRLVAVDTAGNATADASQAAIDYTAGNGYSGQWVDVSRSPKFTVSATGVTTPDGLHTGCIRVAVAFEYRLASAYPTTATHFLGLDQFHGEYALYWKPEVGWVYWAGSETIPQWGFQALTSTTGNMNGAFDLSYYNAQYDATYFNWGGSTNYPSFTYAQAWQMGYQAGYQDVSSPYPPNDRKPSAVALEYFLQQQGTGADDILHGNPSARGRRAASIDAFTSGYALGTTYYSQDFTQNPGAYDPPVTASRSNLFPNINAVPDAFRWNGVKFIDNLSTIDVLDGTSTTGFQYPNGVDGLGETRDIYDETITHGTSAVRLRKDASGRPMQAVYISLPVMGTVTTRSHQGAVTDTIAAGAGNG